MGELPVGWVNTRLGKVVEYAKTIKKEPSGIKESEWVLELEDIEKKSSKLLKRLSYSDRKSKSTKNRFLTGDVLYGKLRPYLDKIIIADQDGYCSTEIIPITPNVFLDGRYLFYSLKRKEFLDYVDKTSHGLNMPRLGTKQGQLAPFILSPLNEQIRIANKLDSLLAKVEAAQTRLDKIPTLLKRFRQAVLAAATSGGLTKEWRQHSAINKWKSVKFEDLVITSANGLAKRKGTEGKFITILRLADFKNAKRVFGNERQIILDEKEEKKYTLMPDDLLAIRVNGSVELAGRFIEYQENKVEGYCDHFIRFRINTKMAIPRYITYVTNEGEGRKYLKNSLSTSAGQNTINQTSIKGLEFSLPSVEEQKQIVKQVESLFALADKVKKQYQQARLRTDKLTQSLLAKAFKGELVPQDPNDEPAEKLLARLQAEREEQKPVKKVRKNRLKKEA